MCKILVQMTSWNAIEAWDGKHYEKNDVPAICVLVHGYR